MEINTMRCTDTHARSFQALRGVIRPGTTLVTDGYEVYNGIAKAGGLTHLGC